jgi:hypothetical protein
MTTFAAVPAISTLVEMTLSDEPVRGVRIDGIDGARMRLSMPAPLRIPTPRPGVSVPCARHTPPASPQVGDEVTLRWSAAARGRFAVSAVVREVTGTQSVTVDVLSEPTLEQHRNFVRGGGGEQVRLRPLGAAAAAETAGWIRDIAEQSLRAHFCEVRVSAGDPLRLQIQLDHDTIEVTGSALRVDELPPAAGRPVIEVVAVFTADEVQAQVIRRYVLRQQFLARARTAGD